MKNLSGSSRVLSFGVALLLFTAGACSDDDDDATGSKGGSGGSSAGSSGGNSKGGKNAAGSSTGGNTAGGKQAGGGVPGGGSSQADGGSEAAGAAGGSSETAGGVSGAGGDGAAGAPITGGVDSGSGGVGGSADMSGCDFVAPESNSDLDTGLTITSTLQTICATIDNGSYDDIEQLVDRDGFNVALPGPADVLVRVEIPGWAALTDAIVYINGRPTPLANGRAAIRKNTGFEGISTIAVRAYNDADIATPLPYKVTLVVDDLDARCPASAAATTFTEAGDAADSRGNDVYQVDGESVASFTSGNDLAEATGITVAAPPHSYRIVGTSADIDLVGAYFDGDAYAFHTGPNASQITLRADWPGDNRDMDLFFFKAGEELERAVGFETSFDGAEYITAAVEPNTDYVVWGGLYEGTLPFVYSLTLCSEAFHIDGP